MNKIEEAGATLLFTIGFLVLAERILKVVVWFMRLWPMKKKS